MIAAGGKDGVLRILKMENEEYVLNQSILVGLVILEAFLTNQSLVATGQSGQIFFFKNNSTEFILDQILATNETSIPEFRK